MSELNLDKLEEGASFVFNENELANWDLSKRRLCTIEAEDLLELIQRARALCKPEPGQPAAFQARVAPWMQKCFGQEISADVSERNHRFLEESLELVQSCGCTASEAHQLVDYVFNRPAGEKSQEVGGVMVTLSALCLAQNIDMHAAGEIELARIWEKTDLIRAKQAAKPKHSPLPIENPAAGQSEPVAWMTPDGRVASAETKAALPPACREELSIPLDVRTIPAAPAMPEGWKLVPVELDDFMDEALVKALTDSMWQDESLEGRGQFRCRQILWEDVLAASPEHQDNTK